MEELGAVLETGGIAAVELAASAMTERGSPPPACPSCSNPMIGPFCAICGQPANTHRRSLGHLMHEFVKDIVSFDSRILRTARALLLRPGELPTAFREGRTQPYVPSVRLYLFVSLLFFLFLTATGLALMQFDLRVQRTVFSHDAQGRVYKTVGSERTLMEDFVADKDGKVSVKAGSANIKLDDDMIADGKSTTYNIYSTVQFFQRPNHVKPNLPPGIAKTLDDLRAEAAKKENSNNWIVRVASNLVTILETDPAALNGPLTAWIPRVLFVLLPLFAGLLALFYVRQRRDFLYVDHLVFSLTMHSFTFVLLIAAAVLAQVMGGTWVALLTWTLLSLYFFLSLRFFYRQSWRMTLVKFVGISFVYAIFFLFPALLFAIAASALEG
jgi:hypothetical protein